MKLFLAALLAAAVAFACGVALGALSWTLWVIGLSLLVLGLAAGVALAAMLTTTGALGEPRASVRVAAAAAVLVGWVAIQLMEDGHLRKQYGLDLARARAASTGLAPDALARALGDGPDGLEFWARGADEKLDEQVVAAVGFGGVAGRWWWRADGGVRLAGSWSASRGLPVGRVGAVAWAVAENALAAALALTVVARARRRVRALS